MAQKKELLNKLAQSVIDGDEEAAAKIAQEYIDAGIIPIEALLQGGVKGLDVVGDKFAKGEMFLPELVLAGDAMQAATAVLTPYISTHEAEGISSAKVVIGAVKGDIHDIGKSIVASMLSVGGFDVHDLGIDVSAKQFVDKANELKAKVIAMSSLLTLTAYYQEEVIKYLEDTGLRDKYYVIVGGSPISAEWAVRIGADGYAKHAVGAKELVKKLLTGKTPPPLAKPVVIE
ncbi:B12-binding domain-containing protein [Chloroflexota bacterium]